MLDLVHSISLVRELMSVGMLFEKSKLVLGAHSKGASRSEMSNDGRLIGEHRSCGYLRHEACTPAYLEVILQEAPKGDPQGAAKGWSCAQAPFCGVNGRQQAAATRPQHAHQCLFIV